MKCSACLIASALLLTAAPLQAVGLGPLSLKGYIDGPRKGFQLTLYNPYPEAVSFIAYAIGENDEGEQGRVQIYPAEMRLGAGQSRRITVIAGDLELHQRYTFRVCAERETPPAGVAINARVCSKLSALRLR